MYGFSNAAGDFANNCAYSFATRQMTSGVCQPTLKLFGAYDALKDHGFQIKRGGVVYWGDDK
jgi:hypothetical protein